MKGKGPQDWEVGSLWTVSLKVKGPPSPQGLLELRTGNGTPVSMESPGRRQRAGLVESLPS